MGTFEAAAEYGVALARAGIDSYDSAMAFTGGHLVSAHRGRSVVRLEGTLFLKRFIERRREARRELGAMRSLGAGPGPDPVPLVASGEGKRGAFVITAVPPGARPLADALVVLSGEPRRLLVAAVGERVRALHDRGLTCPDLLSHHVLVALPDRVFLIDVGRLARRSGLRHRARDLAALDRTLPYGSTRATDRIRFLKAYLGERPRRGQALLRQMRRAARILDLRSRHRKDRFVASLEETRFLAENGIRNFDELMGFDGPGVTRLRLLPDRENLRIEIGGRIFFVKRHRPRKGLATTPAFEEWDAIHLFKRAGIRAMRPVAMGEDVKKGSTIWVEKAVGEPLDDVLRRGEADLGTQRQIVLEVAGILRRMRLWNLHHRDMYLCHLIADTKAPVGERLTLIDLQRARGRPGLRERWFVKDVAQLLHSVPRPPITRTDGVRFLRHYFAVPKLGPREKDFARRVRKKAARIARLRAGATR